MGERVDRDGAVISRRWTGEGVGCPVELREADTVEVTPSRMTKSVPCYVLPAFNVVLAGVLLYIAAQERKADLVGVMSAWDYVPPAEQIADTINFPARLAWTLTGRMLPGWWQIRDGGFLLSVFALWYLIGARAFGRTISAVRGRPFAVLLVYGCGIAGTAVVGLAAVALGLHPMVKWGGLLWCTYFTCSIGITMFRRSKEQG